MVHPTGKSPSQVLTNLFIPDGTPEQHPWWNELERLTVSPENAARTLEAFYNVVVSALAGQVHAPTLVMHSRGDARVPFDEGRLDNGALARQLRKSEKTVRNQVSSIFDKLSVRTRAEAIVHVRDRDTRP